MSAISAYLAQPDAAAFSRHPSPIPMVQVSLQDAVVAVWLTESTSLESQSGSVLPDIAAGSGMHFPEDPDADYLALQQAVLSAVEQHNSGHLLLEY